MPAPRTPVRPADAAGIADAAAALQRGGLVAFPTETVYGLGGHALDRAAVRRIFEAKGRPAEDPLIVHVGSIDAAIPLVAAMPTIGRELAARFWPGPLTLVLPRSRVVPDEVTAGLETVAIRVPAHPIARAILDAAAIPIAAPSANLFSRPSPTTALHVLEDLDGRIDLVIDGGPTTVGVESTVLDLSQDPPMILRPGAITIAMLREPLPSVIERTVSTSGTMPMRSPGLLHKHYSPRAPLTLYEGPDALHALMQDTRSAVNAGLKVGVIAADEDRAALHATQYGDRSHVISLGSLHDLSTVAANLYAALRAIDAAGVDGILVRGFPSEEGLGVAIQDRLRRAAAGRIVTSGGPGAG